VGPWGPLFVGATNINTRTKQPTTNNQRPACGQQLGSASSGKGAKSGWGGGLPCSLLPCVLPPLATQATPCIPQPSPTLLHKGVWVGRCACTSKDPQAPVLNPPCTTCRHCGDLPCLRPRPAHQPQGALPAVLRLHPGTRPYNTRTNPSMHNKLAPGHQALQHTHQSKHA